MSGQLSDADREQLDKAYEDFSSGKRERDIPSSPTAQERDKKAEAPNDAERPDKPSQPAEADAAGGAGKSDGKAAGKSDKPRDETGKFAPAPEPFEGFNDLDPKIQKQFKNLQTEKTRYQNDFATLQGRVPGLQRELTRLQQQLEAPKQTQGQSQKKVDEYLKSEKFKDYESRFPEDALAIREGLQQTVDQLRSEFADSGKPVTDKIAQLEARLGDYEREKQFEAAQRESDRLNEEHPEWKLIAGWEREVRDENGKTSIVQVDDPKQREWHPWFKAWKDRLPFSVRQSYDNLLSEASAESISYVFTQFKRDVQAHLDASGQQRQDAPESDIAERRSEALRDFSPRPSRSGAESPVPTFNGNADSERAAALRFYDDWKAGRKLR